MMLFSGKNFAKITPTLEYIPFGQNLARQLNNGEGDKYLLEPPEGVTYLILDITIKYRLQLDDNLYVYIVNSAGTTFYYGLYDHQPIAATSGFYSEDYKRPVEIPYGHKLRHHCDAGSSSVLCVRYCTVTYEELI